MEKEPAPVRALLSVPVGSLRCGICDQELWPRGAAAPFLRGPPTQMHISYELYTDVEPTGAVREMHAADDDAIGGNDDGNGNGNAEEGRGMLNCARNCHAREGKFLIAAGNNGFVNTHGYRYAVAIGRGLCHEIQ